MPIPRLSLERTALLVIDVQERLLPTIDDAPRVVANCAAALRLAQLLGLPAFVTEQYVKGLGRSAPLITEAAGKHARFIEKTRFSALTPEIDAFLTAKKCDDILICGIEAHVCVQQTVLDLLASGRQPIHRSFFVGEETRQAPVSGSQRRTVASGAASHGLMRRTSASSRDCSSAGAAAKAG